MIVYDQKDGFQRQIHNIENTPFRTKFEKDVAKFHGTSGIGCGRNGLSGRLRGRRGKRCGSMLKEAEEAQRKRKESKMDGY